MGATYKLKRKKADGTLEDVILQGVITDLGQLDGHRPAENTILELLKPSTVPIGKYLYTYETPCNADAVLAICYKSIDSIYGTQYTSAGQYRKFVYSFDEDSVVEQECLQNMGVKLTDELGDRWDVAMSQYGVTEALKQVGGGIPFVQPISYKSGFSYEAAQWAVDNVGGITEPTDGMTIAVRTPNDGNSYGILLSIDNGSNYYPIVRNKNTSVGREYPENTTLILTFNATQTSSVYLTGDGTLTTVTGCWQVADYDTNYFVTQFHTNKDDKYPLMFMYRSGVTSTGITSSYTQYSNNLYVNPSTGTVYATTFNGALKGNADTATNADKLGNFSASHYATKQDIDELTQLADIGEIDTWVSEPQFTSTDEGITWSEQAAMYDGDDNQIWDGWITHRVPLVAGDNITFEVQNNQVKVNATGGGGSGGVQKLTSYTNSLTINSTTVGAHFNVFCTIIEPQELMIGSNTITLDSGRNYSATVEGLLSFQQSNGNYVWHIMVTIRDDSNTGSADAYRYVIITASSFSITHSGYSTSSQCIFSGILYE